MKICLTNSISHQENVNENHNDLYYTSTGIATIRLTTPNIGKNVEQLEFTDIDEVKYAETTLKICVTAC